MDANVGLDAESSKCCGQVPGSCGRTAPEMTYKAWEKVVGSWIKDAEAAKLKDPTLDTAIFGQSHLGPDVAEILEKGLAAFIEEARAHIDAFIAERQTISTSFTCWQSAIIVCEAAIRHARRYAASCEGHGPR